MSSAIASKPARIFVDVLVAGELIAVPYAAESICLEIQQFVLVLNAVGIFPGTVVFRKRLRSGRLDLTALLRLKHRAA